MRDVERSRDTVGAASPGLVVALDDLAARDLVSVGAKAAALATARASGLHVVPGYVLTTGTRDAAAARSAWASLSDNGRVPIAVRSSSPIEDQETSSMAGHFTTVLDVTTWDRAVDAIATVRASAGVAPMAVLLQPMVDAVLGGVLFGIDPVTGRRDRLVVEVVRGNPSALVGGETTASRVVLTRRGRCIESSGDIALDRRDRRRLARLARDTMGTFGGPQDIEWAIDRRGELWLLQSRPVTAVGAVARGPRFGPGPIAETFPESLAPLELDLWMEPLRAGIAEALHLTGAHSRRTIDRSPVLVEVGGRVAADLDLLEGKPRHRVIALIDPRPNARRVAAAWRVGRLRRALPLLAGDLMDELDASLASVPRLDTLDERSLLGLLGRCRVALRAVHGYEVLSGLLGDEQGAAGASIALQAVASARRAGMDDDELVAHTPIALVLVPPQIGARPSLPSADLRTPIDATPDAMGTRELLRVRARYLQELTARAASALGEQLAARGLLGDALEIRWLTLDELREIVRDGTSATAAVFIRMALDDAPPLPLSFRLAEDGSLVVERSDGEAAGRGAGGGRVVGVVGAPGDTTPGTILVVRHLEPGLAAQLPGRVGLVAETGSALSHLAIVARELGIPTVVGVAGAIDRFPPGTRVVVDGRTGEVAEL